MSIYNWIQKTFFDTYEEWHMKSPIYDRNGFNIVGVDNSLKAMHDGHITYTEITPSSAVNGCKSMKATAGKSKEIVDLYLIINDKKYIISDLSYSDAVKVMRTFVKKEVLPDENTYTLVTGDEDKKIKSSFEELSKLLLTESKDTQSFLKKVKHESMEDMENAWEELCEELLKNKKAIELDWKEEKDIFLYSVKELSAGTNFVIDEQLLDENQNIPIWSSKLNSLWTDYVLAVMELHCDTYVLLLLTKEDFIKAQELARTVLQIIAPAEEV